MSAASSRTREASASFLRWFAVNGGGEARRLTKVLESEIRPSHTPTTATDGEKVVALSVIGTVNRCIRSAGRRMRRLQDDLIAAAAGAVASEQTRRQFDSPSRRDERLDREREHHDRQQAMLGEKVDHDAPTVPARALLAVEAIVVLVEVGFWYAFFSRTINTNAPDVRLLQAGAIGLSMLLPLVALLSAHFAGAMWQRLIKHRTRERLGQQLAGALSALGIVAVLTVLVYWLVHFRFAIRSPFAIQPETSSPPPVALALLFASTVVVVALVRTFMTSEVHQQRVARSRAVTMDRDRSDVLDRAVIKSNTAWTTAWYHLAAATDRLLMDVEQIVAAGERVVLVARSRRSDAVSITPVRTPREGTLPEGGEEKRIALPWHTMIELLDTELLPIRRSLQLLQEHRPAALTADCQLEGLSRRLASMDVAGGAVVPDTAPDIETVERPDDLDQNQDQDQAEVARFPRPVGI